MLRERAARRQRVRVRWAWDAEAKLGEGPVWDSHTQCLHFVDIQSARLLSFREKGMCRIRQVAQGISAVFLTDTHKLLCAATSGLFLANHDGLPAGLLVPIETGRPGNRTNDGKCDPLGRVWIGTMDATERTINGALYRIDRDASVTLVLDDIGVSNGLDWSPDGKTFYYTDSKRRLIWRFPFDMRRGMLGEREIFATVPEDQGCPDGLTVDAEGFIWSAHWDGWRITRYDPDGVVERVIRVPVPRVTSLCFGGQWLDTLYITSAQIGLTREQLEGAPLSGALFSCQPGVTGRLANPAKIEPRPNGH
jgi:sugar lactone lactonase YvrE